MLFGKKFFRIPLLSVNNKYTLRQFFSKTVEHAFLYSGSLILAQAFMIIYTVILMRWVGAKGYGIISANYAAVLLLSFLVNWGMNDWLVKTIPTSAAPNQLIGSVIRFKFVVGFFWWLTSIAIFPKLNPNIYPIGLMAIVLTDVWLDTIFNLLIAALIGFEKVKPASFLLALSRLIRLVAIIFLVLFNHKSLTIILSARLFSTLFCLLLAWFLVKPKFERGNIFGVFQVFRKSFAFNSYELLNLVYSQIDVNLLAWLTGNSALIGAYTFVTSVMNMVLTLPMGINSIFTPQSIRTYQHDPQKFFLRMRSILIGFFALGLVCYLALAIPGTQWMGLILGQDYQYGYYLLRLGSPILFLRTLNQVNHIYLITTGREIRRLWPQTIAVLLKASLGVWVILRWQAYGLVLFSILVELILLSGLSFESFRHYLKFRKMVPA